jgi:small subunit ribosomal protein S15
MHSRKGGNSGSTPQPVKTSASWVEYTPEQVTEIITNLANAGHTAAEIGTMLRDQYGIPDIKKLTGKKIEGVLEENKLLPEIPQDMLNLIKRAAKLEKHMKENNKDYTAKRGLQLAVSKIRRLQKYYLKKGKLPKGWRYSSEVGALLVK